MRAGAKSRRGLVVGALCAGLALPGAALADDAGVAADAWGGADAGAGAAAPPAGSADAAVGVFIPGLGQPGVDQPVARAAVPSNQVQLGRAFSVFVTVSHDDGITVNLPASIDFGPAFEEPSEARRSTEDRRRPDGTAVREFELELVAWNVGDLLLPPIPVTYVVQGTAYVVQTEPVPVRVVSFIGDGEGELRDIAPPVEVGRTNWTLLSALIGAAAALLFGLALWLLVPAWRRRRQRRRRARRPVVSAAAPRSAEGEALARLDALAQSGALEADDREPVYVELSEIVRGYLGRRFGFPALDSTTAEIEARLAGGPGAGAGRLLRDCDLVKYAHYAVGRDEAAEALGRARELVVEVGGGAGAAAEAGATTSTGVTTSTSTFASTTTTTTTSTTTSTLEGEGEDRDA